MRLFILLISICLEGTEITALIHGGDASRTVATVNIPKVIIEVEDEIVEEEDAEAGVEADAEAGAEEATATDEGADADE